MPDAKLNRGLSDEFIRQLQTGDLAPLLAAAKRHDLEVQLRNRTLDLYHDGVAILEVAYLPHGKEYRASANAAYVRELKLPHARGENDGHAFFQADAEFARAYAAAAPALVARATRDCRAWGRAEARVVRASLQPGSPVVFLSRQVLAATRGALGYANLIGLTREAAPRVVVAEVVVGVDADPVRRRRRLTRARASIVGPDGRLAEPLALSYRIVTRQKQRLGLLPPDVVVPPAPPVIALAVLCDPGAAGDRPPRPGLRAPEVWVAKLTGLHQELPPVTEWEAF